MPTENQKNNITSSVEQRIKSGSVSMRPRKYFIGRIIGLYLLLGVLFGCALFLLTFAGQIAREFGFKQLLSVGTKGFSEFIFVFPWHIAVFVLLLAFLALLLAVRHVEGLHRIPRMFSVAVALALLFAASFALLRNPAVADVFYENGREGRQLRLVGIVPPYARTYWMIGTVTGVSSAGIAIRQQDTGVLLVYEPSVRTEMDTFIVGDLVLVQVARQSGGTRELIAIRRIGPSEEFTRSGE
jgi:hypothetical protein